MSREAVARARRNPHGALIHLLNQRYHREWKRAELLRNELDGLRRSRLGRVVVWLQRLRRRLWPAAPAADPPLTARAEPYVAPADVRAPAGRVSIVIPFKDRPELLRNCLSSLRATTHRDFEVVLVDNGSADARTLRLLGRLRRRPRYRVVGCPGAFNFARLCNAGRAAATGEHLLFLNNDTEVLDRDWLDQLLRIGTDPGVGVVGATLLYPDRTLQHVGLFPRADGLWIHPYRGLPADHAGDHGELLAPRMVPAVTAACLLIRRDLFDDLGGFEERFPVAYNDVALCLRVRRRGLAVVVTPAARLFHYEALSRGFTVDVPDGV